jgi:hypothetical protein
MRIVPSSSPTGHQPRNQPSDDRFALFSAVTETAAQPSTRPGAAPSRDRAPGMSAVVMPRGPKYATQGCMPALHDRRA